MELEHKYLIEITKKYINEDHFDLREDIDYAKLYRLAEVHNLLGVLNCAISNSNNIDVIGDNIQNKLGELFFDSIYYSNIQIETLKELKRLLSAENIRFVAFKGSELRNYYPVPESRFMGDLDILIDQKNNKKVKEILVKNSYTCKAENGPVWDYTKNEVLFEVHTSILNGKVGNSTAPQFFSNAIDHAEFNGFEGTLEKTYNFEYLIAHIAHHFWFFGAGIKLILDLAIMLKVFDIDLDKVVNDLNSCGLGDFAKIILSICYKWYGLGKDYDVDTNKTESFLCSYGAFGNDGRSVASVFKRKELEDGKDITKGSKLRLLFPSYQKMKEIPYIKFIEGRPYLTPYAWMYRIGYNFKNRKELTLKTAKKLGDEKSTIEAKEDFEYFKEIGLL